jgi:hypothetical protein
MRLIGFVGGIGVALSPLLQHKLEKESHKKDEFSEILGNRWLPSKAYGYALGGFGEGAPG